MHAARVDTLLAQGARRLAEADPGGSPALDAELLLAHVLGCSRAFLRAHGEHPAAAAQQQRYAALLERRARGEPLPYLVGQREFWSLPLAVGPAVLVPRPETEVLVERALELPLPPAARVLDLGTGSGAIALALAHERRGWQLTATDVSPAALAMARSNARALRLPVELLAGSWLAPVAGRRFELIVSNPPYVDSGDAALSDPALRHEPLMALTPGPDGMAALRAIIAASPAHLAQGGWLLLEHGKDQAPQVQQALAVCGFSQVRSHPDLAGHLRVTGGRIGPAAKM
jgi:release factor glutamine methyltransferase